MTSRVLKRSVWNKNRTMKGKNPSAWRKDSTGQLIRYGSYGTLGKYGWEIDHKRPKSKGGSDSLKNLQALNWLQNRRKGNS